MFVSTVLNMARGMKRVLREPQNNEDFQDV